MKDKYSLTIDANFKACEHLEKIFQSQIKELELLRSADAPLFCKNESDTL